VPFNGTCAHAQWPGSALPAPPASRHLRCARNGLCVRPSSRGRRKTSRTRRVHAGRSSTNRMPWGARETSPGRGRGPPPITPISAIVLGGPERAGSDDGGMAPQLARSSARGHISRWRLHYTPRPSHLEISQSLIVINEGIQQGAVMCPERDGCEALART
jgi:hypothetical protein